MREGNLLPIDRFQTNIIIIIMWEGNYYILTDSRQKNNYNYARGQFTTFWQIPDKKIITIVRGQFYILTDSRQKKITIMWEGKFTTFWQIPDKNNNYNYVRGQFTTFWQIPDKKIITIMREGNLLGQFTTLLTDSRQKK